MRSTVMQSKLPGQERDALDRACEMLRSDPSTEGLEIKSRTELQFQKTLYPEKEGQIRVNYRLHIYPDIHKIYLEAVPFPAIRKWPAVALWLLRRKNGEYRKDYGPTMEYSAEDGLIVLTGKATYGTNLLPEFETLRRKVDRRLAEDCPRLIDIYLGIIPDDVRQPLTEEIEAYRSEL